MAKNNPSPLITDVPLTAEARERFIEELFNDRLPHLGELFVPTDAFYVHGGPHKQARTMVSQLCTWLGIKPGYIGLEFETDNSDATDGKRYTIYLENSTLSDEFVLGGFLAYALTRYLIEEQKQIRLPEPSQQASLLASASIVFGLGIVVSNGISPRYSWLDNFKQRRARLLLKNFPLGNYSAMTRNFLRKHLAPIASFSQSVTPWAARRLGLKKPRRQTRVIRQAYHTIHIENLKLIGIAWVITLVVFVGGFASAQRIKHPSQAVLDAQEQITQLHEWYQLCHDSVKYDRQYADLGDIQTVRAINSDELRCTSLKNQLNAAEQHYMQLNK